MRRQLAVASWWLAGLAGVVLLTLVLLDGLAPGGRGFLVVTRANSDSLCYFSTARSLLFDGDFDVSDELRRLRPPSTSPVHGSRWLSPHPATGLPRCPFPVGYSLASLPFLAAGAALDAAAGFDGDGHGAWAERLFVAANVPLLALGLVLLHRFLVGLGLAWGAEPRRLVRDAALAAAALVPATALGYYVFTSMSHTASFCAAALLLATWWPRRESFGLRDWTAIGAAAGLLALCRWQAILLAAAPAAYDLLSPRRAASVLRSAAWWRSRGAAVAACALVFTPQLLQWHAIHAAWLVAPHGPGFLAWPPAHVAKVLFSSHNGLFFTTPATLAGAAGLAWAAGRAPRIAGPLVLAGVLEVMLVGCLTRSWSGHAFAARLLIDATPLVAAGWLYVLLHGRRRLRAALAVWLVAGSSFTLLAAVQWRYELVPRNDELTFAEAFTDKLRLGAALRRGRALRAAREEPDDARRLAALEAVLRVHGESRVLLGELETVARRAGAGTRAEQVARRHGELSRRRLF